MTRDMYERRKRIGLYLIGIGTLAFVLVVLYTEANGLILLPLAVAAFGVVLFIASDMRVREFQTSVITQRTPTYKERRGR
jgi:hypothetical protein